MLVLDKNLAFWVGEEGMRVIIHRNGAEITPYSSLLPPAVWPGSLRRKDLLISNAILKL